MTIDDMARAWECECEWMRAFLAGGGDDGEEGLSLTFWKYVEMDGVLLRGGGMATTMESIIEGRTFPNSIRHHTLPPPPRCSRVIPPSSALSVLHPLSIYPIHPLLAAHRAMASHALHPLLAGTKVRITALYQHGKSQRRQRLHQMAPCMPAARTALSAPTRWAPTSSP